jgi:hypothetical protein
MSYPSDNDVLYAIEARDDAVLGTLVCTYGAPSMVKLPLSIHLAAEAIV